MEYRRKETDKKIYRFSRLCESLSGRPVVSIKTKYYEIDSEKGLTGEISENQIDFRAIRFDAPGYYAADRGNGPYPYCEYVEVYTEITTEPPVTEPEATSPESTDTEEPDTTSSDDTDSEAETTSPEETESNEEPVSSEDADTDEETDSNPNPVISLSEKRNEASEGEETVVIDGKLYSVETVLMWGYRDGEGNTVIEPQFEAAFDFTSDGIAAVVDFEKRMSFIDRTGKTVITLNDKEIIRYSVSSGQRFGNHTLSRFPTEWRISECIILTADMLWSDMFIGEQRPRKYI